ncbi:MAG: MltR family transcriptional regulator [Gemmatimonadaceae bacterium]
MAKKRQYVLGDLAEFFATFRTESDRACAVLARALLEEHLRVLIASVVVAGTDVRELFDGQAPLATFSARIRLAAALGLLSHDEAADLNAIREIGNDFAHGLDHMMSFEEVSIRARVFNIQAPRLMLDYAHLTGELMAESDRTDFTTNARRRFELAVGTLQTTLSERTKATTPIKPITSLLKLLDIASRPVKDDS